MDEACLASFAEHDFMMYDPMPVLNITASGIITFRSFAPVSYHIDDAFPWHNYDERINPMQVCRIIAAHSLVVLCTYTFTTENH